MSESERNERRRVVAMVGNPTSDKGRGAKVDAQVLGLLEEAGRAHNFDVIDITGTSFDDSLNQARERAHEYDYLVVVGGDGMIALGANAVGCSGKPLGIVATGSGNDFARGLKLPVNRIETAVEGIVGAIVRGSHIDVDMGRVTSLDGGYAVDSSTGEEYEYQESKSAEHPIDRYYAGMLSCGLDASINDRANHSHLPTGTMRYFAREFDPENEEFWGIVGLLHDLDWEEHEDDPMNHTIYAAEILEGEGASPELIRAIQSHTSDFNTSLPKPELQMEKILFACDELTGLIGAAVIMRPSKSVMDFTTKSLKKKFKDKRFAAGCSRDVISQGAEMLGWELPELFDRTIAAMQSFAPDRDTFQA